MESTEKIRSKIVAKAPYYQEATVMDSGVIIKTSLFEYTSSEERKFYEGLNKIYMYVPSQKQRHHFSHRVVFLWSNKVVIQLNYRNKVKKDLLKHKTFLK